MDTETSGQLPLLQNFPVDGPRLAKGAPRYSRLTHVIATDRIDRLALRYEAVRADVVAGLHAIFALLLMRCSGETQVRIATSAAEKSGLRLSSIDAPPGRSFPSILAQSAAQLDRMRQASFHVDVVVREWGGDASSGDYVSDLALFASPVPHGVELVWVHAEDAIDGASVERMARRFGVLLDAVATDADTDVWRLTVMDADERRLVLNAWNATSLPWPRSTMHALCAAQAARTPDAIALCWRDERWTFAELDRRANQLAHVLRAQGVGDDSVVAVCLERSPSMVVALKAVLKAGAAYVPLDPHYPSDRLNFMVSDSGAAWWWRNRVRWTG